MSFGGLILTNKGRNLQVKAQTGVALNYSKVKIGDGEIGSSSILDMNDLKNTLHVLDISDIRRNGNQVTIKTIITNNELQEGFYFREIGVFAEDPDEGEILYCYANARSNAEYIPAAGTDIVEKNIDVVVIVGQAENVTATIDESLIFASKKDVESKVSKVEGKGLSDENYSTDEKNKLAGIGEGAEVNRGISDSIASDSSVTAASSRAVKQVNDKVNNRVVKVNGKGLSTEDYSSGEKDKLAGIEEGAEVNREISDRVDLDSSSIVASSKAVRVVSSSLADIVKKQGDLTTLQTTTKSNLVGALNEVFQDADNGKTNIYNAIVGKGTTPSSQDFRDLVNAISNISIGIKSANGSVTYADSNSLHITALSFRPSLVVMYCSSYVNANDYNHFQVLTDKGDMGRRYGYSGDPLTQAYGYESTINSDGAYMYADVDMSITTFYNDGFRAYPTQYRDGDVIKWYAFE